eukprot:TRINITY_DN24449_c1_g1_i1.p1 TRINITY_DN24449_c1_g1~~TRINITY_DN24449_c1_g1_i1.p1  ORF type:complete len:240 (+),score=48.68 TRINITY_DN24449_c1_g1_i1:94-813(+)
MRLYNSDLEESERNYQLDEDDDIDHEHEDEAEVGVSRSFFDLKQKALLGMDQMPAFRVVALGLLRKLRSTMKCTVQYSEVEDALGRYFRLLDADMQKFANLHETLRDALQKTTSEKALPECSSGKEARTAGLSLLNEGMREIAVVLLACGEMQRRALDLKIDTQKSIAQSGAGTPPLASFSKFADFFEEALGVCDQLRRKREELQQQRIRAMASLTEARLAAQAVAGGAAGNGSSAASK